MKSDKGQEMLKEYKNAWGKIEISAHLREDKKKVCDVTIDESLQLDRKFTEEDFQVEKIEEEK